MLLALAITLFSVPSLAQDFSVGYRAETSLPTGIIVSLVSQDTRDIEPANMDNADDLLGVVVGGSGSLLMISTQESNVQVVTSGVTNVLVTDEEGDIGRGDYITTSSIQGVGRLAKKEDARVLGIAQAGFQDSVIQTVRTVSGDVREVSVARLPVLIQIGGNPEAIQHDSFLPDFLQEGVNSLAGEPVPPARIIVSLAVAMGGVIGSMVLLYGAVSSTIISIGRNPLSGKSVYSGLFRMVVISFSIIAITVAVAYVILVGL